jgi:AraC-like DNA-binding protein
MEPNKVYIIPTGVPCSYHCDGIMRKLFFHVNVYNADHTDLLRGSQRIGCISVTPDFVEQLLQHYRGKEYLDAAILQAQLLQLLGTYLRQCQTLPVSPPSYSEVVLKTIDYIRQHLSVKLRNEELAQQLFVSRTYLTDRFRKETGMSLGKYIDYQLMYEAQLRLCQTDDSIYAISQDLGFSNQCYFSRRFKQMYGLTPLQYRKNNR